MEIKIREANPEDLTFICTLEEECFPVFQRNSEKNIKHAISSQFQKVFLIEAACTQEFIGSCILYEYKHTLRIYSIAISPAYQNQGIGSKVLSLIYDRAQKENFNRITLEVNAQNSKLIAWYQSHNFKCIETLNNYYSEGQDALKMELILKDSSSPKPLQNIIVLNRPFVWKNTRVNANIISVKEYINNPDYQNRTDYRIFNLCSSYKYQSYGYYVSLLASARGQRVIPNNTTLRDLKIINVIKSATFDIDELINQSLEKQKEKSFSINIFWGQCNQKGCKTLASKLYQLFEAPLFKVNFIKSDKWLIKDIKILTMSHLNIDEEKLMFQYAETFFSKKRHNRPRLTNYKYDLAILVNPNEEHPPSNIEALQKLKKAANKKGVYTELITKSDTNKINEFDALFIRETTNVNHHTYEISRLAYAEGLVVLDDPWSILRCSNKIYQNELFKKHKIKTPNTEILTKNFFRDKQLDNMNFPMVIKQPDSAFSLGVIKVDTKEEAIFEINKLFKVSDMLICQEFLYSDFDWRIGILDNRAIFACKYFMSENHWQIYHWESDKEDKTGAHETIAIEEVPANIVNTALKAAALVGDGLYGVDLKQVNNAVYVVEVNDNPNLDS